MKRLALLLLLMLALLCAMGFDSGAQSNKEEVLERASFIPRLAEYHSKPTVETSARYEAGRDVLGCRAHGGDLWDPGREFSGLGRFG